MNIVHILNLLHYNKGFNINTDHFCLQKPPLSDIMLHTFIYTGIQIYVM